MLSIDIRLLAVFDEICKSRSVTLAAAALGLGQPAVSVALSKLRRHFDDPLFVRTSTGMEPTPFAGELVVPVRAVLEALDLVLGKRNDFDPASSERTFRISMTDISQLVLLPGLLEKLRAEAPGLRIQVLPITGELARQLESGEADLALGYLPQLATGFYQQVLFHQKFVCMVSSKHPRIAGTMSREQFEAEDHAVIGSAGSATQMIERAMAGLGISRRIVLDIHNFISAALVAAQTDLVVTVPKRLGDVMQGRDGYQTLPVPFALPEYEVKQMWHQRFHNDPGNRWLRRVVSDLLSEP